MIQSHRYPHFSFLTLPERMRNLLLLILLMATACSGCINKAGTTSQIPPSNIETSPPQVLRSSEESPADAARKALESRKVLYTENSYRACLKNARLAEAGWFLKAGMDPKTMDGEGHTALHLAALKGDTELAKLSISKGGDLEARDVQTFTPLHYASWMGHTEVVKLLLDYGAKVNATSRDGDTALLVAVAENRKDAAELLISKGADIHAKGWKGRSPLHQAVNNGQAESVKLLVDKGAEVNARDKSGATPLKIALDKGYGKIAEFLRSRGGKK